MANNLKKAAVKLAQDNPEFRKALLAAMRSPIKPGMKFEDEHGTWIVVELHRGTTDMWVVYLEKRGRHHSKVVPGSELMRFYKQVRASKTASEMSEEAWDKIHQKMAKIAASVLRNGTTHDYWASTASLPRDVGHGMYLQFGTQSFPRESNAYFSVWSPMLPRGATWEDWGPLYSDLQDLLRRFQSSPIIRKLGRVSFKATDKVTQVWIDIPPGGRTERAERTLLNVAKVLTDKVSKEIVKARSDGRFSLKTGSARLIPSLRQKINAELVREGFGGRGRWRKPDRGYAKALEVLSKFDIELDEVVSPHLFRGPQGRVIVDLAFSNPEDPFSPESISNSVLRLDFTDVGNGYEIIGYLS